MPSGGSSKQTVGYRYYLGCHMGLCHGPIDAITEIQVDKRVAWTGLVTEGTITVDAPTLFGGEKREGGVSGQIDVEMGYPNQLPNDYLQSQLGADIPAFRGVASLVFRQCYMGNNPYLKPWKFKAARTLVRSNGEEQWNPATARISGEREGECAVLCNEILELFGVPGVGWGNFTSLAPTTSTDFFPASTGERTVVTTNNASFDWLGVNEDIPLPPADCGSQSPAYEMAMALNTDDDTDVYITDNSVGDLLVQGSFILRSYDGTQGAGSGHVVEAQVGGTFTNPLGVETTVHQRYRIEIEYRLDGGQKQNRLKVTFDPQFSAVVTKTSDWFDVDESYKELTYIIRSTDVYVEPANALKIDGQIYVCLAHSVNGGSIQYVVLDETNNPTLQTWGAYPTYGTGLRPADASEINALRYFEFGDYRVPVFYTGEPQLCGVLLAAFNAQLGDEDCSCTDMNPAHIIRECLTDATWGMGYPDSDIDDNAFELAATALFSEDMGMSILWEQEQPIEDFVGEVLRHIDAVLYVARSTGKFVLKLIREEAGSGIVTLDESNVAEVMNARRPTISELSNAVTVTFWNAATDENASVTAHNEALRLVQGAEISASVSYPGFSNKTLAAKVAQRDLKALSTPLLSCEVVASRAAAGLEVGDAFYLDWPDLNISNTLMRVDEVGYGDGIDNSVTIVAVQDVFSTPSAASVADTDEQWIDPAAVAPASAVARIITETPYFSLVLALGETQINDILADGDDAGYLLAAGGRQGAELNANVHVDAGAGYVNSATVDFHPYAYLAGPIGYTETSLTIESGTDLDLVESGTIAQIGHELVRVDSIVQDSNGDYVSVLVGRGILDTVPQQHEEQESGGIVMAFWGDYATSDDEQYAAGEAIDVKLQTALGSTLLSLSDAPADSVIFDSRAVRPYPPGDFRVDGLSYPDPYAWTATHTLTWSHRDRLQQTDGNLYDHTEGDIGPEPGVSYIVEGIAIVGDSTGDFDSGSAEHEKFLEVNVGTDTTYTIDIDSGAFDSNYSEPPEGTTAIILRVLSRRDGHDSWQAASLQLQYAGFTDSVGDSVGFDSVGDSAGDSVGDSVGEIDSIGDSTGIWTPAEITTALWLDADDASTITESGGAVSQWDDKSGNARHVAQSTSAARPTTGTRTINGKNVLDFDGGDVLLSSLFASNISQPASVFSVWEYDSGGGTRAYIYDGGQSTNRFALGRGLPSDNSRMAIFSGAVLEWSTGQSLPIAARVWEAVHNGASSAIRRSGTQVQAGNAGTHTLSAIRIGDNAFGSGKINGAIAEVIIVEGAISTANRQLFEGYLSHKWGLEAHLPGGHPYKSAPP